MTVLKMIPGHNYNIPELYTCIPGIQKLKAAYFSGMYCILRIFNPLKNA